VRSARAERAPRDGLIRERAGDYGQGDLGEDLRERVEDQEDALGVGLSSGGDDLEADLLDGQEGAPEGRAQRSSERDPADTLGAGDGEGLVVAGYGVGAEDPDRGLEGAGQGGVAPAEEEGLALAEGPLRLSGADGSLGDARGEGDLDWAWRTEQGGVERSPRATKRHDAAVPIGAAAQRELQARALESWVALAGAEHGRRDPWAGREEGTQGGGEVRLGGSRTDSL
tara:strand:- start:2858 stop:3538 length:681 start_codon:yes stop_codon:yes gene_type:complete